MGILKTSVPNLRSILYFLGNPENPATSQVLHNVHNMQHSVVRSIISSQLTIKQDDHSLSVAYDCSCNISKATIHTREAIPSVCNLRKHHTVVTRDPMNMNTLLLYRTMLQHDVWPHNIINKNGNFSYQITNRTALFVAPISNQSKEKRKMILDTAILMIMALAKKRLEPPSLGEILNFSV